MTGEEVVSTDTPCALLLFKEVTEKGNTTLALLLQGALLADGAVGVPR